MVRGPLPVQLSTPYRAKSMFNNYSVNDQKSQFDSTGNKTCSILKSTQKNIKISIESGKHEGLGLPAIKSALGVKANSFQSKLADYRCQGATPFYYLKQGAQKLNSAAIENLNQANVEYIQHQATAKAHEYKFNGAHRGHGERRGRGSLENSAGRSPSISPPPPAMMLPARSTVTTRLSKNALLHDAAMAGGKEVRDALQRARMAGYRAKMERGSNGPRREAEAPVGEGEASLKRMVEDFTRNLGG